MTRSRREHSRVKVLCCRFLFSRLLCVLFMTHNDMQQERALAGLKSSNVLCFKESPFKVLRSCVLRLRSYLEDLVFKASLCVVYDTQYRTAKEKQRVTRELQSYF